MADNYLERKLEEHNAKKAGLQKRKTTPTGSKPGYLQVKFPKRRVFVTGGAAGIGKAIVEAFCNAGCQVAFCDCNTKTGQATAEATGSRFYPANVANVLELENVMDRIFKDWGDIDIIVNNAGIAKFSPLTETSIEDFDQILSTNLRPAFATSRRLAMHRKSLPIANPFGRIINICSTRYLMSEAGTEAYSASKGGIYSLTHALAVSLADFGITVNSISPGWIECGDYDSLKPSDHDQHPSKRVGKPADIARICLFLCEEGNDFINGENITVDGGMTKKMIYKE